jgi:hypothetical protein
LPRWGDFRFKISDFSWDEFGILILAFHPLISSFILSGIAGFPTLGRSLGPPLAGAAGPFKNKVGRGCARAHFCGLGGAERGVEEDLRKIFELKG